MDIDPKAIVKSFSPRIATRALRTFDKATVIVVAACWGAAVLMVAFALYTVSVSASTRRAAEAVAASEPNLPKIIHHPIDEHAAKPFIEQLNHHYPTINFSLGNDESITAATSDGSRFRDWLSALGYIDTVSPEYRWTIRELCVGKCSGNALMRAVLVGEKISFEAPHPQDNR